MPADKRFSKGTRNSKLTRGEFVERGIVLRFLLVKKLVSINIAHALYRDNGPLNKYYITYFYNVLAASYQYKR